MRIARSISPTAELGGEGVDGVRVVLDQDDGVVGPLRPVVGPAVARCLALPCMATTWAAGAAGIAGEPQGGSRRRGGAGAGGGLTRGAELSGHKAARPGKATQRAARQGARSPNLCSQLIIGIVQSRRRPPRAPPRPAVSPRVPPNGMTPFFEEAATWPRGPWRGPTCRPKSGGSCSRWGGAGLVQESPPTRRGWTAHLRGLFSLDTQDIQVMTFFKNNLKILQNYANYAKLNFFLENSERK